MSDAIPRCSQDARKAFLAMYCADIERDQVRTLPEYLAHYPGFEEHISEEWSWLEPASEVPGVAAEPIAGVPENIGHYRILAELGRGAQAIVYLAEHTSLRRRVALKVMAAPTARAGSKHAMRFRREAEIAAQLDHACICRVHEADLTCATPWIAMQLVMGQTLAVLLERRRIGASTLALPGSDGEDIDAACPLDPGGSRTAARHPWARLLSFFEQVGHALHAAHACGLVHRDIKPGNLMVRTDGQPVILDFGLARLCDDAGYELTRTEDVLGTPYYMAPEQLQSGQEVAAQADVFAMGVTLYESLTGRRPFDGVSREALFHQILHEDPAGICSINPGLPRDLEVVVAKALAKDKHHRYASAQDLADELRRVRTLQPILARPPSWAGRLVRWSRRNPMASVSLAGALLSLLLALVVSLFALQSTSVALQERGEAVTELRARMNDLYGVLSLWRANAAHDGVEMPRRQEFEQLSLDILASIVPSLREQLLAQAAERTSVVDAIEVGSRAQCQLFHGAYRDDLRPIQKLCLADNLALAGQDLLRSGRWDHAGGDVEELLRYAHLVAEIRRSPDQATDPWDVRYLQAGIQWLEVLLLAGEAQQALLQATKYLDELGGNYDEAVRYQLCRVRALVLLGRMDEASQVLKKLDEDAGERPADRPEGVAWLVADIGLADGRRDEATARAARGELAHQLARSDGYNLLVGELLFRDRPAVWSAFLELLDAIKAHDADRLACLSNLTAAMAANGIQVPGPESAFLARWPRMIADLQIDAGITEEVMAFTRAAEYWSRALPEQSPYPLHSTALATLALAHMERGEPELALPSFRAALREREAISTRGDEVSWIMRGHIGQCLLALGEDHFEEAEQLLRSSLRVLGARSSGASDPNAMVILGHLLRLVAMDERMADGVEPARERLSALATWDANANWMDVASWGIVRVAGCGIDDYQLARLQMRKVVAKQPDSWRYSMTLAMAHYRCHDLEQARAEQLRSEQLRSEHLREPAAGALSVRALAVAALIHHGVAHDADRQALLRAREVLAKAPASAERHEALQLLAELQQTDKPR